MDGGIGNQVQDDMAHLHAWLARRPEGLSVGNMNTLCQRLLMQGDEETLVGFFTSYPQVRVTIDTTRPFYLGGKDVVICFCVDGRVIEHCVHVP
jgi:hypothetical protein